MVDVDRISGDRFALRGFVLAFGLSEGRGLLFTVVVVIHLNPATRHSMDIEARRANAQSSTRSQSQSQTSQSQTLSITPSATGSRTAASLTPIPLSALSIPNTPISVGMGVGMGGIMGAGAGMGMDELTPSSMLSGGRHGGVRGMMGGGMMGMGFVNEHHPDVSQGHHYRGAPGEWYRR
ncbi:hypothetical protein PTI98_009271 [Pleurotus ostreatus]|nr:hypothetical protein PTI98_009271 [Pleurotus ostreatus]